MPNAAPVPRFIAVLALPVALLAGLLTAAPAAAVPDPADPGVTDAPGLATEATIVEMLHQGGLFGGTATDATATTPYPSSGLVDERPVETALIVLDDPQQAGRQDITTYCIDLGTETEIGVHYELGDWTEANVPNLPYVQWILDTYPTSDATDAAAVEAVQGAIWYFTDRFVVPNAYPEERAAIEAIVEAAQAALGGGAPPAPALPTLTLTPDVADIPDAADIVTGPFTVGGSAGSGVLDTAGVSVYSDAEGTVAVPDGSTVTVGTQLWIRFAAQSDPAGFSLTSAQTVPAGNVFLYDGDNPGRTTAQKLVLAASAIVPVRAAVAVDVFAVGSLAVDVVIAGAAAGEQSEIGLLVVCTSGDVVDSVPVAVPAGQAAGTVRVAVLAVLPVGTSCTVTQTASGANDRAVLSASTIEPATVTITDATTSVVTVTDTFAVPAPGPTPTPTPTPTPVPSPVPTPAVLPSTGVETSGAGPLGVLALLAGAGLVLLAGVRRRARCQAR